MAGRQEDMMGQDDGAGEEDKKRSIKNAHCGHFKCRKGSDEPLKFPV